MAKPGTASPSVAKPGQPWAELPTIEARAKKPPIDTLLAVMEFALILRELLRRRVLLALGVLIAAAAAIFSVYRLEGSKLVARSLQYSSASTQVLVDTPSSVLGNINQPLESLNARAEVFANFMASPAVLRLIGEQAGISGEQLYAAGPVNANEPRVVQEPTALKRNVQLTGETAPYKLNFESQANLPTITIDSQAPTTKQAVGLANAAAVGLQRYVAELENANRVGTHSRVTIRPLGLAQGGVVNGGISKSLAVIVFAAVFLLWCILMLAAVRFRQNWHTSAVLQGEWELDGQELERDAAGGSGTHEYPQQVGGAYAPHIPAPMPPEVDDRGHHPDAERMVSWPAQSRR